MGSLTLCSWKWFSSRKLKTAELLNIQDWPRQYFAFFLAIYLLKQESPVYQPPKTQQLTTSALDLYITLSSIGVHPNPPEIWRTLPWRIETRNRKTTMKNTLFFFSKLLFVPIANNFSLYLDITSVICFWPHKIQIHSVYRNVFSSKYKLSIFSYQHNPMVKSCKTAPVSEGS